MTPKADGTGFFLGHAGENPLLLAPRDLTTHAVCLGMTGSGKTGLCLALLEEAHLAGVPLLALDPKGDVANLALAFPELSAADFRPWIDEAEALREGLHPEDFAAREAARCRAGIEASGQDGARIRRLLDAGPVTIYTPGSDAGVELSLLPSLEAPPAEVRSSPEPLRERVDSTVAALLGLAGVADDGARSRERVLLAALLTAAWAEGRGMDMPGLLREVQQPSLGSLGVLDLETYFPRADRFSLVVSLNGLLAQARPGDAAALDIDRMLFENGAPRAAVVSLAHLGETERRAFVTLLLGRVISWMRGRPGASGLRALLFLDEAAGYLPPLSSPPTKPLFLTLFKQARAYGLGVVVASQNPADLDYKVLSNAGTWMVGRLQTARDRAKVREGLEGAFAAVDASRFEKSIGGLKGREFLLVTRRGLPERFTSRFTLSYLRGPLSLAEISLLRSAPPAPNASASAGHPPPEGPPLLAPSLPALYVPRSRSLRGSDGGGGGLVYAPCALGAARLRYVDRKLGVEIESTVVLSAGIPEGVLEVDWAVSIPLALDPGELRAAPDPAATFLPIPTAGRSPARFAAWKRAFAKHLADRVTLELLVCEPVGLCSGPGESEASFRGRLGPALARRVADDAAALRARRAARARSLTERVRKAEQLSARRRLEARGQQSDALLTAGASVLGALLGGKAASAANAQRAARVVRGAKKASGMSESVARADEDLSVARAALARFEAEQETELAALARCFDPGQVELRRAVVSPQKPEVLAFGLGFLPLSRGPSGLEPAFSSAPAGAMPLLGGPGPGA